jgi:hypothetical protein
MTKSSPRTHNNTLRNPQRGAVTVLIGLTLVMICVMLVIGVAQTTTLETRMSRNSLLANQARQAALAGFNYGAAWLKTHHADWLSVPDGSEVATPTTNPPMIVSGDGDSFAINVTFERRAEWAGYLRVESSAVPGNAPEVEAIVSQFLRPSSALTWAGETAPPLVVDGCADLSGASDLYPLNADSDAVGAAISSSSAVTCLTLGTVNTHGGSLSGDVFPAGGLWSHLLSVSRDEFQTLAATQSDAEPSQRDYWWATAADLNNGEWQLSLGSPQRPIVLIIPAELGCPRFSGGAQLVGLVLIEADCTGAAGWGDVRLYGSLGVSGDFASLGPGSRLFHIGEFPGGGAARIEPPPLDIILLAGSWKDF